MSFKLFEKLVPGKKTTKYNKPFLLEKKGDKANRGG